PATAVPPPPPPVPLPPATFTSPPPNRPPTPASPPAASPAGALLATLPFSGPAAVRFGGGGRSSIFGGGGWLGSTLAKSVFWISLGALIFSDFLGAGFGSGGDSGVCSTLGTSVKETSIFCAGV